MNQILLFTRFKESDCNPSCFKPASEETYKELANIQPERSNNLEPQSYYISVKLRQCRFVNAGKYSSLTEATETCWGTKYQSRRQRQIKGTCHHSNNPFDTGYRKPPKCNQNMRKQTRNWLLTSKISTSSRYEPICTSIASYLLLRVRRFFQLKQFSC